MDKKADESQIRHDEMSNRDRSLYQEHIRGENGGGTTIYKKMTSEASKPKPKEEMTQRGISKTKTTAEDEQQFFIHRKWDVQHS